MIKHLRYVVYFTNAFMLSLASPQSIYAQQNCDWQIKIGIPTELTVKKQTGGYIYLRQKLNTNNKTEYKLHAIDSFKYMVIRKDSVIRKGKIIGFHIPVDLNDKVNDGDIITYYDIKASVYDILPSTSFTFIVPYWDNVFLKE